MKHDEIEVHAVSVWEGDEFQLSLDPASGRPMIQHKALSVSREVGRLRAVYVSATDRDGRLEVQIFARDVLNRVFAGRPFTESILAREAESYATRKMLMRFLGPSQPMH